MSQIHSPLVTGLTTSILFKSIEVGGGNLPSQSFNSSLKSIEPLLFSVAKHLLPAGAVVDDTTVNATSVHKPETECDFFVKIVNAV
ncbi:hypothetical protein [Pseudomonas sp. Xaverov 83]|uniref:hypothetical protein n=1 Tax=Pseudomonas sp. Xaverov 83 TaxID=2666087 RepID=UPI001C5B9CF5|nr:hypothetical protein [Pseudomonas sp. Xaverov 83]